MKNKIPYHLKIGIEITCNSKEDLLCHLERVREEIDKNFQPVKGYHIFISNGQCLKGVSAVSVTEIPTGFTEPTKPKRNA